MNQYNTTCALKDESNQLVELNIRFDKKLNGKCEAHAFDSKFRYFYVEELENNYDFYVGLCKENKLKPVFDRFDDYIVIRT